MKRFTLAFTFMLSAFLALAQNTPLQNMDFENWTTKSHIEAEGWKDNNPHAPQTPDYVSKVSGVSNSAIRLQTIGQIFAVPAYIANTTGNAKQGQGGAPFFAGKPTHLNGYYRYDVVANDSAQIYVILKKNGNILTRDSLMVKGSQSAFTAFSMPISPLSATPDSVIITIVSSIKYDILAPLVEGTFIEVDELSFSNGTVNYSIPNGNFDSWPTVNVETCDGWPVTGDGVKTTDKYSGSYAMKLTTKPNASNALEAGVLYGNTIPLSQQYTDTLIGYYKYLPQGSDQGYIEIWLFKDHQNPPEVLSFTFKAASVYTKFIIPLTSNDPIEDMSFRIMSSYNAPKNGSVFIIDKMELHSGKPVSIKDGNRQQFSVYPNPATDELKIQFNNVQAAASVYVLDIKGSPMIEKNITNSALVSVPVSQLPKGIYYYEIRTGENISRGKFAKN